MDVEKLGALLRVTRIQRSLSVKPIHMASLMRSMWESWTDATAESKDLDVDCAERVAKAAYHEAMIDAIRICERRAEEHQNSVSRCADARDFLGAGAHLAASGEAKRCAAVIQQLMEKTCT